MGSKSDKNGIKRTANFRRLWSNWADGTTLHGIKFIFGEDVAIRRLVSSVLSLKIN